MELNQDGTITFMPIELTIYTARQIYEENKRLRQEGKK